MVAGRLLRIVLLIRLISEKKHLQQATRHVVSQNKRRYQKDGFDLDLCYITSEHLSSAFHSDLMFLVIFFCQNTPLVCKFMSIHRGEVLVLHMCDACVFLQIVLLLCHFLPRGLHPCTGTTSRYVIPLHSMYEIVELFDMHECWNIPLYLSSITGCSQIHGNQAPRSLPYL